MIVNEAWMIGGRARRRATSMADMSGDDDEIGSADAEKEIEDKCSQ